MQKKGFGSTVKINADHHPIHQDIWKSVMAGHNINDTHFDVIKLSTRQSRMIKLVQVFIPYN